MTPDDYEGPWGRAGDPPPAPATPPRSALPARGVWLWLGLLVAVGALVVVLARAFPGVVRTPEDWAWVGYSLAFTALISTRLLTRGVRWRQAAWQAGVWMAVIGILAMGYTYRNELLGVGERVKGEFVAGYPVAGGHHELMVTQSEGGGYFVMAKVNGQPVRFLIDTGASDTVLSPADARRIGLDPAKLDYRHVAETANGLGSGAPFTADRLELGSIQVEAMPMVVNQADMSQSLLGMSFLNRLDSFRLEGGRMYLKARN